MQIDYVFQDETALIVEQNVIGYSEKVWLFSDWLE